MNTLDHQIKNLFITLVNSNTKYLAKIDYINSEIIYRIPGHIIKLRGGRSFTKEEEQPENKFSDFENLSGWHRALAYCNFEWKVLTNSNPIKAFQLIIDGKNYTVVGLSRAELANALDLLDDTISNFEAGVLQEVTQNLGLDIDEDF